MTDANVTQKACKEADPEGNILGHVYLVRADIC